MNRKFMTQKQICDSYPLWTFKRELSPYSFLLELSRRAQLFKVFITARFNYMQDRATAKRGLVQQHLKGSRPIDLILNYLKSFVAQFTNFHCRRILGISTCLQFWSCCLEFQTRVYVNSLAQCSRKQISRGIFSLQENGGGIEAHSISRQCACHRQ